MNARSNEVSGQSGLTWEADTPIFRNPTVMFGMLGVIGFSTLLLALILLGITVAKERYEKIPEMLGFALLMGSGMLLLMMLVCLLVLGGRMRMRVSVDDEKVVQTVLSRQSGLVSGMAAIAGLAGGGGSGATLAGSGLIAASNRSDSVRFEDLTEVIGNPVTGEIRLRNDWRMVMQLFVPRERHDEILAELRVRMEASAKPRERIENAEAHPASNQQPS